MRAKVNACPWAAVTRCRNAKCFASGLDRPTKALNHWGFQALAKMIFEIGVISIVVLAVGYWVTLWLMGRHDDVLHGDFVHDEDGVAAAAGPDQSFPSRPPFPAKPILPAKPALTRPSAVKPSAVKPTPATALPAQPSTQVPAPALSERSDTLQTLLASIKRDLKDASQL